MQLSPEPGREVRAATGAPMIEFLAVMVRLRAECPWKQEQTHRSLARYLVEELHETLEAIDTGDDRHLAEELGDLLLQVYFHAVVAAERGAFTLDDVAEGVIAKMIRRNPHVFGDGSSPPGSAAEVNDAWQRIKAQEKVRTGLTNGIPDSLPALLLADKVLDRLTRADRPVDAAALAVSADLGDRLLALVAEAHADGIDPEQALRDAVRRSLA